MTVEEIQQLLRTICLERIAALRERRTYPDAEIRDIFVDFESHGFTQVKPSPGRTALAFASLSFTDQELIEDYAERLINEAHALCMRLQKRCPILRQGEFGELWDLERIYRAQHHAMARLRRRCDEGLWIRAHIRKARRWLEEAYVETMN